MSDPDSQTTDNIAADPFKRGFRNGLLEAVRTLDLRPSEIRLHADECTAGEMRTVQAVLGWMRRELEHMARSVNV